MGVLQRFERRLEGLVGNAFARLFKGQVEPVEVAKALQREAEEKRSVVGAGRVLVPNRYDVQLGSTDYERLAPWEGQLTQTLAEMVQEHIDAEGWSTFGDIEVSLSQAPDLPTGMFRINSRVDPDAGPRRRPVYEQGGYDQGGGYGQPGYDQGGYDQGRHGQPEYDQGGYDPAGYNQGGYDQSGYDQGGYAQAPHDQGGGYNQGGYDQGGYDQPGYDQSGHGQGGYDQGGGYNQGGYDQGGYGQPGYDQSGHGQGGYDQGGYDQGGYDQPGYNQGGYDQGRHDQPGYDQPGYDQGGYGQGGYQHEGQPEPDYAPRPPESRGGDDRYGSGGHEPPYPGGPGTQARHWLIVDGTERRVALEVGPNIVGRGQDARLRLADTGVSRRHVEIRFDGHTATLADLGSTNGTIVNGHRVQSWQLADGDVIRIGHSVVVYRQGPA